jgi:hypothetical protein
MNRTGYALGRLSPIIYYENVDGVIVLPPTTEDARYFYEKRGADGRSFKDNGFEIREADTLQAVDTLQRRLVEAERRRLGDVAERDERVSEAIWKKRGEDLRARLVSGSTSEYEKDFIRLYLQLRDEKRAKHRQRWLEAQMYLEAREFDSSHKAEDRMRA